MADISFEWDESKNSLNKKKHGVPFEEAQTVFSDENALLLHDPDHSEEEDRFILPCLPLAQAGWFKFQSSHSGCLSLLSKER